MSLLSYTELCSLIEQGVIQNASYDAVNSASIDLHMGNTLLLERPPKEIKYLNKKSQMSSEELYLADGQSYVISPDEFILASTREIFNLPNWLSAEYKLKSSMARLGLDHLNAGWADAGWNGSVLTLELKNVTRFSPIAVTAGDRIGQMVFFKHEPVPDDKSYAARGSYNGDLKATGVKIK